MENLNVSKKTQFKKYTGLKIATAIFFALACIFYIVSYIDLFSASNSENFSLTLGFFIAISIIILGPIVFSPTLILSLIGLISSIINLGKKRCSKGSLIFFITFILLPIILYFAMIFITKLFL